MSVFEKLSSGERLRDPPSIEMLFLSHPQILHLLLRGSLAISPGLLGSTKPAGLGSDATKVMFLMAIPASVSQAEIGARVA